MTEPSPAGSRRLRIVEIAVLADDDEFTEVVERLSTGLEGITAGPRLRPVPATPAPAAPVPVGPVHPGDFW